MIFRFRFLFLLCSILFFTVQLEAKTQTLTIPQEHDSALFCFQLNSPEKISFRLNDSAGKKLEQISFTPKEEKWGIKKLAPEFEKIKLENHYFSVVLRPGIWFDYYVRPRTKHYNAKDIAALLPEWMKMPDATQKIVPLELRFDGTASRIYIDGRYAFTAAGKISGVQVDGAESYALTQWKTYRNQLRCYDRFEPLNVGTTGAAEAMKNGTMSLKAGLQYLRKIPFEITAPENSSDIAVTKNTRGRGGLEEDMFLARDTFHALREAQVISVPADYYHKIHLVFALDPDAEKVRKFTVKVGRSTRFGRTTPAGYTDIVLPDDEKDFPDSIRKIGTVTVNGQKLPLYLGTFPLALGDYMGLLEPEMKQEGRGRASSYIDIEIFGPRIIRTGAYVSPHLKPTGENSAVNLFGATLEKAPAFLRMTPAQPAYIFLEDEKPETRMTITAKDAGKYKLELKILDLRDCKMKPALYDWDEKQEKPLRTVVEEVALAKGAESSFMLNLAMPRKGHYATRLNLYRNGERILTHPGGFALLGKPDRRAGKQDSPYSMWWLPHGVHCTWTDLANGYDIITRKLGIHKFSYAPFHMGLVKNLAAGKHPELADAVIQPAQMRYFGIPANIRNDEAKMAEFIDKTYGEMWKLYPNVKSALIFHESYGDTMPPEVLGIKKELTEQEKERDLSFVRMANALCKWYRQHHPDVKLIFGNNTSSTAVIAALLRSGFDPKYIDMIGMETPGQGCMPERIWRGGVQGQLYMKELLKFYNLDIPLTACYEYTARPVRLTGYGYEYKIRDILMAYAGGYDQFPMGGLQTAGGVYTQSIWGGGILLPEPYRYPTPAVSAVFAMTNVLDQAVFEKSVPTGSNSVYLQEYRRKRGDYVYVAWAPAGENKMQFVFPDDAVVESSDMYGDRKNEPAGSFTKNVNAAPLYLISSKKIKQGKVTERLYPPMPQNMKTVVPLADTDEVFVLDRPFYPKTDFAIINGDFTVRAAKDEKQGNCLEIKLNKTGNISLLNMEYLKLKLTQQVIIHDNMDWIGLWVKGDSGWGKISFDLMDANGRKFISDGVWHDFDCQMTINHDGWRFMKIPFGKADRDTLNPSLGNRWQGGNSMTAKYPLKITAVNIGLRRVAPDPVDWVEVPGCIRIKGLAVSGAEKFELRRKNRYPDARILERLKASGLRELVIPYDVHTTQYTRIEDGKLCRKSMDGKDKKYTSYKADEIHFTASGPILSGYDPFLEKDAFAIEVCFKFPSGDRSPARTELRFNLDRKSCFVLSPASKEARFAVLEDVYVTARFSVKDKVAKCFIDGKEVASVPLEQKIKRVTLSKGAGLLNVLYFAICDNGDTVSAASDEVGATNAQEQDNIVGNQ